MSTFDPLGPGTDAGPQAGDEYNVDFNGVGDWGNYQEFEEGPWVYTITKASPERSKKGNNPMIELGCTLNVDMYPDMIGRAPVRDFLTLTPDALPRVKGAYAAIMGIPKEVVDTMKLTAGWWNDLLGKDVVGLTVHDPYTQTDDLTGEKKTTITMKIKDYVRFDPSNPPKRPEKKVAPTQPQGEAPTPSAATSTPGGINI